MSSVYYNISQFNNTQSDELFQVNQTTFQPVLDQQNEYQVGVKRFKIPASTIDTFRIYEGEYAMGVNYSGSQLQATSPSVATAEYQICDLYNNSCNRKSEVDSLRDNRKYMTIQSQSHFAQVLTRTTFRLIRDTMLERGREIPQADISNSSTSTGQSLRGYTKYVGEQSSSVMDVFPFASKMTNPVNLSPTQPVLNLLSVSPQGDFNKTEGDVRKFMGFEFHLKTLSPNVVGEDCLLSELVIRLECAGVRPITDKSGIFGGASQSFLIDLTIASGLGTGVKISEFNTTFPNGIKISSFASMINEGQSDFDSSITPEFMPQDDCDFQILGSAGEYLGIGPVFYLKHRTSSTPNGDIVVNTTFELTTFNTNEDWFINNSGDLTSSINTIGQLPPYFKLDNETDKRLQLNTTYGQIQSPFNFLCNAKLMNIIGFDGIPYDNGGHFYSKTGDTFTSTIMLNSQVLTFDLGERDDNLASAGLALDEPELSLFKRNFLYAILITANSLSIAGEFEGNGSSSRKILSDFEIDPSTNFRDYMIYQPSGNSVRYYDMNSSQPLRDVFVSVFFRDMFNVIRPLTIGAGNTATIKLHFRKKDGNYINN